MGLARAQFQAVARAGLGDPANAYVHAMTWFNGSLYIGVTRFVYHGLRPYDASPDFEIFPVKVSAMPWDNDTRGQIWRFEPESALWECVHVSPWCTGSRGFDVPRQLGFRDMAVFQGRSDAEPVLYAASWSSHMGVGPAVHRSADGTCFEELDATEQALGSQTLRALVPFKGRLFTVTMGRDSGIAGYQERSLVLCTRDPVREAWLAACRPGFGSPRNVAVADLFEFAGHLYAGTMNPYSGYEVWRTAGEGDPPFLWEPVLTRGADRGPHNEVAASFAVHRGALYVGGGIYHCGYDRVYNVGPDRPELVRVYPDGRWDLVVGHPRDTRDGLKVPTSGLGPGFNNPFTGYIWRLCAHEGWLFAGTCESSSWIPFSNRRRWPPALRDQFLPELQERFMEERGGFDLWRSRDGDAWQPVTRNGFGNRFNCGARTLASTPAGLFVGTVNQFGPKVATQRVAGWRYEWNERGGFEVWLGREKPLAKEPSIAANDALPHLQRSELPPFVEGPARDRAGPLDAWLGPAAWQLCGFWGAGIHTLEAACENLMEEVCAFFLPCETLRVPSIPTRSEVERWLEERALRSGPPDAVAPVGPFELDVLDVDCKNGRSTHRLLRYFPAARVVGTGPRRAVKRCPEHLPGVRFVASRLPRLSFSARSFDRAVCVQGPGAWGNRARLLAEVLRVLRPGGLFAGADLLLEGDPDPCDYGQLLLDAGFEGVRVEDVTERCLTEFRGHFGALLAEQVAIGLLDEDGARRAREELAATGKDARGYVLICARRPGEAHP